MAINFEHVAKIIRLTSDVTEVTIQDLYNASRLHEETFEHMPGLKLVDGFGKQDFGGGKAVGITMVLLDGWRIGADDHAGPTIDLVTITGGNLVAETGAPVIGAAFVTFIIEQDTSAALITANLDALNLSVAALEEIFVNKKDIDFTGADLLGWQEVAYEDDDMTVAARWNLFDETDTRINETAAAFVARGGMIKTRTPV